MIEFISVITLMHVFKANYFHALHICISLFSGQVYLSKIDHSFMPQHNCDHACFYSRVLALAANDGTLRLFDCLVDFLDRLYFRHQIRFHMQFTVFIYFVLADSRATPKIRSLCSIHHKVSTKIFLFFSFFFFFYLFQRTKL